MSSVLAVGTSSLQLLAVDASDASVIGVHEHKSHVRHVRWAQSGDSVVSTLDNSSNVLLTYSSFSKSNRSGFVSTGIQLCPSSVSAACIVQKGKLALTTGSTLHIYDVGSKKNVKNFQLNYENVSMMDSDNTGVLFVGSSDSNSVCSISLNTHTVSNDFANAYCDQNDERANAINCLRYNRLLLAASAGRSVTLYDVRSSSALKAFTEHMAPATAVAFSPLNPSFLLSAGLDKRCIGYDTRERRAVCTIMNNKPLNALDTLKDGKIIVVGDTRGKIALFDLRDFSKPIKEVQVGPQGSSINDIACCPKKMRMTESTRKAMQEMGNKENLMPNNEGGSARSEQAEENEENSYVFSPVQNGDISMGSKQCLSAATASFIDHSSSRRLSAVSSRNVSLAKTADLSIFSPLQQQVNDLSSMSAYSPLDTNGVDTNQKIKQSTPAMSPLLGDQRAQEPQESHGNRESTLTMCGKEVLVVEASTTKPQQVDHDEASKSKEQQVDHEISQEGAVSISSSTIKAVLQAFPTCVNSNVKGVNSNEKEVSVFAANDVQKTLLPNSMSREEEAVEDLRDLVLKMHFDMRYHIVEMFHEQQKSFRQIVREVMQSEAELVNQELLEEVNRLRRENEELKKYF